MFLSNQNTANAADKRDGLCFTHTSTAAPECINNQQATNHTGDANSTQHTREHRGYLVPRALKARIAVLQYCSTKTAEIVRVLAEYTSARFAASRGITQSRAYLVPGTSYSKFGLIG